MMARFIRAGELLGVLLCFCLLSVPATMFYDASQYGNWGWMVVSLALFWLVFDLISWPVFRAFILRK